jgi:hypothetical protein
MHPAEEAVVRAFIAPHRRPRWLKLLGSPRRRQFLDRLNHCADLDPRYIHPLGSGADAVALLRSHGAPSGCYVLSDTIAIDGREMPLAEALAEAETAGWGTIISCIPGRLGYYLDECGARRFLLVRPEGPDP